jgi:hypothetical protein
MVGLAHPFLIVLIAAWPKKNGLHAGPTTMGIPSQPKKRWAASGRESYHLRRWESRFGPIMGCTYTKLLFWPKDNSLLSNRINLQVHMCSHVNMKISERTCETDDYED